MTDQGLATKWTYSHKESTPVYLTTSSSPIQLCNFLANQTAAPLKKQNYEYI